MTNNIIQKGTPISCGDHVGIALSEPVTVFSLRHLGPIHVDINESWSRIYIDTSYCWTEEYENYGELIITGRSFPKNLWDDTLFTAIFGNKKSWMLTCESRVA